MNYSNSTQTTVAILYGAGIIFPQNERERFFVLREQFDLCRTSHQPLAASRATGAAAARRATRRARQHAAANGTHAITQSGAIGIPQAGNEGRESDNGGTLPRGQQDAWRAAAGATEIWVSGSRLRAARGAPPANSAYVREGREGPNPASDAPASPAGSIPVQPVQRVRDVDALAVTPHTPAARRSMGARPGRRHAHPRAART